MIEDIQESALKFPCVFPIKALGVDDGDFDSLVVQIVARHTRDLGEGAVKTRSSRKGKYVAVTVTINARSQEQLDAIYTELSAHERVMMAL